MNTKAKISYREILGYLLIGISVMMLGKSLMLCFSNDIWYDELFTVGMIQHSYGDLIAFTARDVHPPLYYCIVKSVAELCKLIIPTVNIIIIAKIVSVLPYFILLLYSVTFIRRRFGILTGGIFMFCVIAMPQLSAYTVEVRMYGFALLFVTAAFLHAYAVVTECEGMAEQNMSNQGKPIEQSESKKTGSRTSMHAVALVLYGLAAAYTQYFACVAVIMVYLYVLIVFLIRDRGRVKQWILWVTVSVIGYIPWLYALYGQIATVNENYWILPLSWRTLGGCVKFLMKPAFTNNVLSTVLAVVLFAVYTIVFMRNISKLYHNRREFANDSRPSNYSEHITEVYGNSEFIIAGVSVLAGLVLFGFIASAILRPIFVYRYMIPALGCFWLSFAVGLGVFAKEKVSSPTAFFLTVRSKAINVTIHKDRFYKGVILAVCIFVIFIGLRDYRAFMGEEEYKILLMKDTNAALNEIGGEDILICNFDQIQMVTGFYIDNDSYLWYGQSEALIQEICGDKGVLDEDAGQIKEWISQGNEVWFLGSFNSREDIIEEWRAEGISAEETGSYLLERYWFNLYKLSADG